MPAPLGTIRNRVRSREERGIPSLMGSRGATDEVPARSRAELPGGLGRRMRRGWANSWHFVTTRGAFEPVTSNASTAGCEISLFFLGNNLESRKEESSA